MHTTAKHGKNEGFIWESLYSMTWTGQQWIWQVVWKPNILEVSDMAPDMEWCNSFQGPNSHHLHRCLEQQIMPTKTAFLKNSNAIIIDTYLTWSKKEKWRNCITPYLTHRRLVWGTSHGCATTHIHRWEMLHWRIWKFYRITCRTNNNNVGLTIQANLDWIFYFGQFVSWGGMHLYSKAEWSY